MPNNNGEVQCFNVNTVKTRGGSFGAQVHNSLIRLEFSTQSLIEVRVNCFFDTNTDQQYEDSMGRIRCHTDTYNRLFFHVDPLP